MTQNFRNRKIQLTQFINLNFKKMKTLTKIFAVLTVFIGAANANAAAYRLTISNPEFTSNKSLEFGIYLLNTDKGELRYLLGQYFIDFNPGIADGGTLKYAIVGSDLPPEFIPRNPSVSGNMLRLACNTLNVDKNNLPLISSDGKGTLIVKMKIETTSEKFDVESADLKWTGIENRFKTKIFTYIDNLNTEITNPDFHFNNNNSTAQLNLRGNSVPDKFELLQNYPNPFNPETKINFQIPSQGPGLITVKLAVYDITGKEVSVLVNENMEPGSYEYTFNGKGMTSGVYFYRLTAGSNSQTFKMLLIK